jgi:nitrous oxidase accessory protein
MEFDNTPATIGSWVRVERNLIAFNEVGFSLMSTAAITATENVIVENLQPVRWRGAATTGDNRWAAGGRGNYWGDYAGFDAAGDGIGDVPYRRTDLLEELVGRAPALQAFLFTPAHLALEAGARLVPLVRAAPIVEDPAPLMRAPGVSSGLGLPTADVPGVGLFWTGVGMLVPAIAGLVGLRLSGRRP